MADEEKQTETMTAEEYIKAINELKARTVDKAVYDKLVEENKTLIDGVLNGAHVEEKEAEPVNIEKLKERLFDSEDLSNIQYAQGVLELRKAIMDEGGRDPFLPNGHAYVSSAEDEASAQRVADALQYCIDKADGDSGVFTAQLDRITVDTNPFAKLNNRR